MTEFHNFIILKAETYDVNGSEKIRFAAAVTDDSAPDVVFFFDDFAFVESDSGGIQAQCHIHFKESNGNSIGEDDPRYDKLFDLGRQILEQVTQSCINEMSSISDEDDADQN